MTLTSWIDKKLSLYTKQKRYRSTNPVMAKDMLNFASNDYLCLSTHPHVQEASRTAVERYGCSARSSRLVSGTLEIHEQLEFELAKFLGFQTATLFGSGFLANLGVISAITSRKDAIFEDRLNHASLIDGARITGARVHRYVHNDLNDLEEKLQKSCEPGKKIIITDALFSMDGDIAPLKELSELAQKYNATLIVDEAHSIGVFGKGLCHQLGVRPDIVIGTFAKALGGYGGFALGSTAVQSLLINRSRPLIYSTAPPPACCAAALAALHILEQRPEMGKTLLTRANYFSLLLLGKKSTSQIIPLIVNCNDKALHLSSALSKKGIISTAIRPPTVPVNTARLRFSIYLNHSETTLRKAAQTILETLKEVP